MVGIRSELRARAEGTAWERATLLPPPTTIEWVHKSYCRLTCRPNPTHAHHLLLSHRERGTVTTITSTEKPKLCFVPHGYSTLTFKWRDAGGWVAGWPSGRVTEDNDSIMFFFRFLILICFWSMGFSFFFFFSWYARTFFVPHVFII